MGTRLDGTVTAPGSGAMSTSVPSKSRNKAHAGLSRSAKVMASDGTTGPSPAAGSVAAYGCRNRPTRVQGRAEAAWTIRARFEGDRHGLLALPDPRHHPPRSR